MTTQEELQELKTLRAKIISALSGAVDNGEIENYSFSDGEGSQSVRRRSPKELTEWLEVVDQKIAVLERSLKGGGVRTFSTNRYA